MKLKVDFEELKKAVQKAGKAVKRQVDAVPIIKIEAVGQELVLSLNSSLASGIAAEIRIPAKVEKEGVFVTTFQSINIVSIRKCSGDVNISNTSENTLLLKYKGGDASNVLTMVSDTFYEIPKPADNIQKVALPLAVMKDMVKSTIFLTDNSPSYKNHIVKLNVVDDEDGIIKFSITTYNDVSLARRVAYTIKNGNYTGSAIVAPDNIKNAIDILGSDEENMVLMIDGDKVFLKAGKTKVFLRTLDSSLFKDIEPFFDYKKDGFNVSVDKAEFIEALSCVIYVKNNEPGLKDNTFAASLNLKFGDEAVTMGCVSLSSFQENVDAEVSGQPPRNVYVNADILKEIASYYPNDTLVLSGIDDAKGRNPLWLCAGEQEEYAYGLLRRHPVN